MLRLASALSVAAIAAVTAMPAGASGIGTITDVVNRAFHTPPGGAEIPAKAEDTLVPDEILRTEANSTISVLFVDGSELSLEGGSEVVLSDYVYDSQTASSTGVIELNEGLFHFNSNDTADSGIVLQTPIATIGIRGTEFLVTVASDATIVDIVDGEVEVAPRRGGVAARCVGGQSALVSAASEDAICGDFGSFSTAAGVPAATPTIASGEARGSSMSIDRPNQPTRERSVSGPKNEPPGQEPQSKGNHSGHDDGSNPGKGNGKGRQKDNGGNDNPGGTK